MTAQKSYQTAIRFATAKHLEQDQKVPGTELPYVVHLSNVAMEILMAAGETKSFNTELAVQLALLHDTLEDTSTTFDELKNHFGETVAKGVAALTKDKSLPKPDQMSDSLRRIKLLSKEVWAVKLADRITNLQPPPPHWDIRKIRSYADQAEVILEELRDGNDYLANRLKFSIGQYSRFHAFE